MHHYSLACFGSILAQMSVDIYKLISPAKNQHGFYGGPGWFVLVMGGTVLVSAGLGWFMLVQCWFMHV